MGFYEDDRIRKKNSVSNDAYELVLILKQLGLSDSDIVTTCESQLSTTNDFRNEIYSTVLRIVGGYPDENIN